MEVTISLLQQTTFSFINTGDFGYVAGAEIEIQKKIYLILIPQIQKNYQLVSTHPIFI
jgi:hypothetical protein